MKIRLAFNAAHALCRKDRAAPAHGVFFVPPQPLPPRPAHPKVIPAVSREQMMAIRDPVHPADDAARMAAHTLLCDSRHAALAYTDAASGGPGISRIAFGMAGGVPATLISALSAHHAGLTRHPACAIMLGDPGPKGDPLTHPRLMIQCHATFIARDDAAHPAFRAQWLQGHPKAKLYVDFADFTFALLTPHSALLNAGFGKAFRLLPADLMP
jgi:heme iron utilization protein